MHGSAAKFSIITAAGPKTESSNDRRLQLRLAAPVQLAEALVDMYTETGTSGFRKEGLTVVVMIVAALQSCRSLPLTHDDDHGKNGLRLEAGNKLAQ